MKKFCILLALALTCLPLAACGGGTAFYPEGYEVYEIGESNGKTVEGYGCQLDSHLFRPYNHLSEEDLALWKSRIREMNLQVIRTQVFPEWFERGNDNADPNSFDPDSQNVDFDSAEMLELYKVLDICQEEGILVDLSVYGCNSIFRSEDGKITGSWLGEPFTNHWITAPRDDNEFAEAVSALLSHMLDVKKYTCIREFSIYPEPNLSFIDAEGKNSFDGFVSLCKTVDARLKEDGLRDRVEFSGPADASTSATNYENYLEALSDVFDRGTSSVYLHNASTKNYTLASFGSGYAGLCDRYGMNWGVAEFGSNLYVDAANQTDIDTYDRALYLARFMINLTNQGCTNIKYWVLGDVYYGDYIMNLGLWKFRDDDGNWTARPQFYTWSLITKYTELGAKIFPVESDDNDLCMVAFELSKGKWTYLVCNSGTENKRITLSNSNGGLPGWLDLYEVTEARLPDDNKVVGASKRLSNAGGTVSVNVKPNSFVVLSNRE